MVLFSTFLADAAFATLTMDGSSSSILFDNNARLTTTCQNSLPPPPPPLAPAVVRMQPDSFTGGIPADASVQLRLKDVPLSCSNTAADVPCALPFDEMDGPMWSCLWNNSHATEVVGPLNADVSFHKSLNATEKDAIRLSIHVGTSPCAPFCEKYQSPPLVKPKLECPLPSDLTPFMPNGPDKISLYVSFRGAASSSRATQVPFVGLSNEVEIQFSPPMPPSSPPQTPPSLPPPPPPPLSPPPLTNFPWYTYTAGQFATSGSRDLGIRIVPIYVEPPQRYTWNSYGDICAAAGLRAFYDCAGSDSGNVVFSDYTNQGTVSNLGGHDLVTNFRNVFGGQKETGNNGFPLVNQAMAHADLLALGLSPGKTYRFGTKHAHCDTFDTVVYADFTLTSNGFSDISAYSTSNAGPETAPQIDLYMCACRIGEDCEGEMFNTRSSCPTSGSNPCS